MSNKIHECRGGKIVVTYDVERCIHARECVLGMPAVFDPDRHPWVDPDAGDADALAGVVARCPTGALHFAPAANGPLVVSGPVEILGADGAPCFRREKTALCRCGSFRNKPFCDASHKRVGFAAA